MSKMNLFGGDVLEDEDYASADRGDDVPSLEDTLLAESDAAAPAPEPEAAAPEVPATPPVEPEPAPEPAPEPPAEAEADKQFIPRARFNEINEQRKAAERRAQELEARLNSTVPASEYDFEAREREYMDAVLEGDHDQALAIRKDIRAAEMDLSRKAAAQQVDESRAAFEERTAFDQVVARVNKEFPVFDPEHTSFQPDLVDEALDLYNSFLQRGTRPSAAMERAVRYVASANNLAPAAKPAAAPAAPRAPAVTQSKLDMAASQPPMQAGASGGETTPDYANLSDKDWDALPSSTKARLRGDLF